MKRVFDGKTAGGQSKKPCGSVERHEYDGCGCACIPATGSLGSNKPTVQVKW